MRLCGKMAIAIVAVIVLSAGASRFVDGDPGFDLRIAANAGDAKRVRALLANHPEIINSQRLSEKSEWMNNHARRRS
jgi:hypothetical protein